ncbi:GFA family protein [Ketobacter sp.]
MIPNGLCGCSPGEFDTLSKPLFRLVCHCRTCQLFFGSDYNDECTFLLKDCTSLNAESLEFKSYQRGFSPIKRGQCIQCGKPKYCKVKMGSIIGFVSIPTNYLRHLDLPPPIAHIYYDNRTTEVHDAVKKIAGHRRSQAAIQWAVLSSLFRRAFLSKDS